MKFAIICKDKAGALQTRLDNRPDHVAYLKETSVEQAGPFLDADGNMYGSLVIIEVADLAAAEAWVSGDPYGKAGLFASVQIETWNRVIG